VPLGEGFPSNADFPGGCTHVVARHVSIAQITWLLLIYPVV